MSYRRVKTLFSAEALMNLKWHRTEIPKRVRLSKFLKYLEQMFPIETCTYFWARELHKTVGIESKDTQDEQPVSAKKRKAEQKRLFHNPVSQLENSLKLSRWDKVRRLRTLRVSLFLTKKQQRSHFNVLRTQEFSSDELEYFERCKEERLARDGRRKDAFCQFIESNSSLTLDSVGQKQLLVGFLGYVFGAQLKYLIETVIRAKPGNSGNLLPLPQTEQIMGEDLRNAMPDIFARLESRKVQIERKRDNVD